MLTNVSMRHNRNRGYNLVSTQNLSRLEKFSIFSHFFHTNGHMPLNAGNIDDIA